MNIKKCYKFYQRSTKQKVFVECKTKHIFEKIILMAIWLGSNNMYLVRIYPNNVHHGRLIIDIN